MDARIERLVMTNQLKTNLWHQAAKRGISPSFHFDQKVDAVMLLIADSRAKKIVHYIDDHVALLYDPDSLEIIGLRIENFQKSFLPKYAELQKVWKLSEACKVHDLGELEITVRKQEVMVAREISSIARPVAARMGMDLPAFV